MKRTEALSWLEKIQADLERSQSFLEQVTTEFQPSGQLKGKRILVISNLYPPQELGGYGRLISDFANILQARGHTIQVLSADAPYLGRIIEPDFNIYRQLLLTGNYERGMHRIQDPEEVSRIVAYNDGIIRETIRQFAPDVCLVGNIQMLGVPIFTPLLENNIPIIHHLGFTFLEYSVVETPKSSLYHLSAASEYVKHSILKQGYPLNNISVIYPGAWVKNFYNSLRPDFSKLRIVYAGLVIRTKGIHTLLEALKILHSYFHVDFDCSIAGNLTYEPEFVINLQNFITINGLEGKVKFLGYQSRDQVIELFRLHNVLVFPSIAEEAFGISQVEAMAGGLLVITTGVGGASEVVEYGISGLTFPPENAEVLARQLYSLLGNRAQWERMAKAGQERVMRLFDINHSVNLIEKKIHELLCGQFTGVETQYKSLEPLPVSLKSNSELPEAAPAKISWENFQDFTYSKRSHLKRFRQFGYYLGIDPEHYDPVFDLKFYQDLLIYTFITDNFQPGAKLLEVGGGNSRVIQALKNKYECWNVDKFDSVRTGPSQVEDTDGYRLIMDYIGEFSKALPDNYFDCVFSISALEHSPEEEDTFRNICKDINRCLKPGGLSIHCFDAIVKKSDVWTNKLLTYMFDNITSLLHRMIAFSEMREDPDLYVMSEKSYNHWWKSTTKQEYEVFGKPFSYNILWKKEEKLEPISKNKDWENKLSVQKVVRDWGAGIRHKALPKISIVTPSYNQSEFIEECIDSVLSQGYPHLEYVIMDGGSTDGSVEIIKKYEKYLTYWQSQSDGGQYAAIDQGFTKTSGEIMAWINSDDKYHTDAFFKVAALFNKHKQVEWLMGRPTGWNRAGRLDDIVSKVPQWSREYILSKQWLADNLWIQQESTFWKRTLWEKAGGKLREDFKIAGDFELWLRFFRHAQLFFVDTFLGGFRSYDSNRSKVLWEKYLHEIGQAINEELNLIKKGQYTTSLPAPPEILLQDEEVWTLKQQPSKNNAEVVRESLNLENNTLGNNTVENNTYLEKSVNSIPSNQIVEVNQEFLSKQREFWNVDSIDEAMFSRVFTCEQIDKMTLEEKIAAWKNSAKASVQQILEELPSQPNWKVLEIGCGVGRVVKPMRELFAQVDGVDISEKMIQFAHQYLADGQQNGRIYINNGSDLKELPSAYYDFVYSIIVFQHIRSISVVKSYFQEVFRVLKPNGYFKIQVHEASSIHFGKFDEEALGEVQYGFAGNGYTTEELGQLLTEHDFDIVSLKSSNSWIWATAKRPALKREFKTLSQTSRSKAKFKVSAIVSTYNSEEFIRGCLQDLVEQTLYKKGEVEIIVVDSASEQNEQLIVREFESRYSNIVYERTLERETLYASWNRAIKRARGVYITNSNTDDRHRPDALEVMANYLDTHPEASVVYADQLITHIANDTWATTQATENWNWPAYSYSELEQRCIIGPQPMWRKSLHKKYGYFRSEFTTAGDYEFWLRIGKTENLVRLPEILGLYYFNPRGLSTSGSAGMEESRSIGNEYRILPRKVIGATVVQPLVSVIIPTKDRPEMLVHAVQSVLAQTFPDVEIIVVNDGGTDVQEVLDRINSKSNIAYLRQDRNQERSAARNTGIGVARGKYIAYLDDDDMYYPNHVQTLVEFLENSEYKVAYTDAVMAEQQKQNGQYVTINRSVPYSFDFDNDKILVGNFIPMLCLMHEKSCLDETGLFDVNLNTHEDWDLLIRLSRNFKIAHINETTCEFTRRDDSTTTTSKNRADFVRTREIIYNKYSQYAQTNLAVMEAQHLAFKSEAKEVATQLERIQEKFIQSQSQLQVSQEEKQQLESESESWQQRAQQAQLKLELVQEEKNWVELQSKTWRQTAQQMQVEIEHLRTQLKQAQLPLERVQ